MTIVRLGGAINANGINMDTGAGNLLVYVSSGELYALDGNGDRLWVQTLVGNTRSGTVEMLADGRALLTAPTNFGFGWGNTFEIRNLDGTVQTGLMTLSDGNSTRADANTLALADGRFFVTYGDFSNGSNPITFAGGSGNLNREDDITWRVFSAAGVGGAESLAWNGADPLTHATTNATTGYEGATDSAQLTNGGIAIAYRDTRWFGTNNGPNNAPGGIDDDATIMLQIGTADGGFAAPIQVNTDAFDLIPNQPGDSPYAIQPGSMNSIVALADGGVAVIWHEYLYQGTTLQGYDTKIRYFDANGTARTGEVSLLTRAADTSSGRLYIQAQPLADGRIAIAYNISGASAGGGATAFVGVLSANGGIAETLQISPSAGAGDFYIIDDMAIRTDGTMEVAYFNATPGGNGAGQGVIQRFGISGLGYNPVAGGASGDGLTGGAGADYLSGEGGADVLSGAGGDDRLWGGAGADTLSGGDGADRLNGDQDNDQLDGGAGDDSLSGGAGADQINGGLGVDTATYANSGAGVTVMLGGGAGSGGEAAGDTLVGVENLIGSGHADVLTGDSQANRVEGRDGNDTIFGGDGSDTLNGDHGNDTLVGNAQVFVAQADSLSGGAGDDLLYGEAADTLNGGAGFDSLIAINAFNFSLNMAATSIEYAVLDFGNDTIDASGQTVGVSVFASGGTDSVTGSSFADLMFGGSGNDTITGGAGADALVGEAGADSLSGGDGDDRIYVDAQDGFISGSAGYDAAYITPGTGGGTTINMGASMLEFVQDLAGFGDTLLGSTATVGVTAYAGGGADTVDGSAFADVVWGEAGDDVLAGNAGNDVIVGGAGSDRINGGAGNDALYGGAADGVRDTFAFHHVGAADADAVYEFEPGVDKLDLSVFSGNSFANVSQTTVGGSTIVYLNGQQVCTVVGVIGLTAGDFVFSPGGSPADPGDDWLAKGDGPLVQPDVIGDADDASLVHPWVADPPSDGAFHDAFDRPSWAQSGHSDGWLTVLV